MRLSDFRNLISNMPVRAQAFTAKKINWESHLNSASPAGAVFQQIFGPHDEITISRQDLREHANSSRLDEFVVATILWGYPNGMRGNNVTRIVGRLAQLKDHLNQIARGRAVSDWQEHYQSVRAIGGVGLSTYTKLLAFLCVEVHGLPALILDERIVRIIFDKRFEELQVLGDKSRYNPQDWYPEYLQCINEVASSMNVSPESIEFFLFEFGLNLKMSTT